MDYYLTDKILHPSDSPEQFTEQLYRLPVYYQYPIQEGLPSIRILPLSKMISLPLAALINQRKLVNQCMNFGRKS